MPTEPPRIRDDRRDSELTRMKERVAILEDIQNKHQGMLSGMHFALFGIPEDKTSNGLVGTMAELKTGMTHLEGAMSTTVNKVLIAIIAGVGIDILSRALFTHGG